MRRPKLFKNTRPYQENTTRFLLQHFEPKQMVEVVPVQLILRRVGVSGAGK
jgi:hypothetical protein